MKKHWYVVQLSKETTIRAFAEDSEGAQHKAEAKLNKRNSLFRWFTLFNL